MGKQTNDESYYMALNVVDRITELAIEKYGTLGRFSREMGWCAPRWGVCVNNARSIKLSTLVRIAKKLDVCVEFLLTGKNKSEFADEKLSHENLGKIKISHAPNNICVQQSLIRKGILKDISVYSLFNFEDATKQNVMKILRGIYEKI